ncbi:MAG: hypothetical protein U5K00_12595 [Melioribacteraceae bacterium]|nr:hypothetical protein [Melioribacteraceae bacterium]
MAKKIEEISIMENLQPLGLKARQFVTQNFDRKKQSQKLVKIIEQLEEK